MAIRIPPNQIVQTLAIQNTRDGQEEKKRVGVLQDTVMTICWE